MRFSPNIPFTFTVRDSLALQIAGSDPPLEATSSTKMTPNLLKLAAIVSLVSPLLGGLIFWQGPNLVESIGPAPDAAGAGGALAAQWPPHILTEVIPPDLPGKIMFFWRDLVVDSGGVRTLGTFFPVQRMPRAFIKGPSAITVRLPAHSARRTYRLVTQDLRGARQVQWMIDGVRAGRGTAQEVQFQTPGLDPGTISRQLSVEVRDQDGLMASHGSTERFEVSVPPGKQPF